MKSFQEVTQHKGVRWGALVALLVGMTQFNNELELFYTKWNADKLAQAAQQRAEEAKKTADGVEERFDTYIQQQQQALEVEKASAEAIQRYIAQQQQMQLPHQPASSERPQFFEEQDADGQWWCCTAYTRQACFEENLWESC